MSVEWRPATSEAKAQVTRDWRIAALQRCAAQKWKREVLNRHLQLTTDSRLYGLELMTHHRDHRERANEDRATRGRKLALPRIDPGQRAAATIIAKQDCILAGVGCVPRILDAYATLDGAVTSHYEVTSHPSIFDGIRVHKGQQIAVITHNARVILSCERVILNFLQRMSGVATTTRQFGMRSRARVRAF
jgi:hypothetical protein